MITRQFYPQPRLSYNGTDEITVRTKLRTLMLSEFIVLIVIII